MIRALIFCLMLLVAFSGIATVWGQGTPTQIEVALEDLSSEIGQTVTLGNLQNWQWMEQVFPDASLGCPQPDQSYAQVFTRGFQFQLQYRGQAYDYRVAADGSNVILCSVKDAAPATPVPAAPAEPTATLPPSLVSTPGEGSLTVTFEDVQFTLDSALASGVTAGVIEAIEPAQDVPFFGVHPAYTEFQLADYVEARQGVTPTISIYPLAEFEAMLPDVIPQAAEEVIAWITGCPETPVDSLPHLAPINAPQVFAANLLCLDFENGRGLRYITAFRQDVAPFTQQDLLYVYQGISDDRQFYVSALVPVTTDILPEMAEAANIDDAFVQNYTAYINETIDSLTELDSSAFTPDLSLLDDMVSSITISGVGPAPTPTETMISWEEAQELIESGNVTAVTQLHSLEVRILLEDGSTVVTQEPAIDDVLDVIRECGQPCASIVFATE
jgi:hypothetical protein